MDYGPLGKTGIEISRLGFGCGNVGGLFVRGSEDEQRAAVTIALEGGITYFDTAAGYGDGLSEQNLGRTLRDLGADPVIGTKVTVSREEVGDARRLLHDRLIEGLARLGRDHVDVCTLHGRVGKDLDLDPDDVCGPVGEAMAALVDDGLCRAVGFTGTGEADGVEQVVRSEMFAYFQCAYCLSNPSAAKARGESGVIEDYGGVLAAAQTTRSGVMCIRVLAGGLLVDGSEERPIGRNNERRPDAARHCRAAVALQPIVGEFGLATVSEVAIAYGISNPQFSTVLVGISDRGQVESALRSEARAPFDSAMLSRLEGLHAVG